MEVLQAVPEVQVEALLTLGALPKRCEFVYVTSTVPEEELRDILIEVLISLIIIGREVDGLSELCSIVVSHLADLDKLAAVFINEQLQLRVQLLNGIFIFLPRVSDEFLQPVRVQVEVEVCAEELSLIEDLVGNHQPLQIVGEGKDDIFKGKGQVLMPFRHLLGIPKNIGIVSVIKAHTASVISLYALFVVDLAIHRSV